MAQQVLLKVPLRSKSLATAKRAWELFLILMSAHVNTQVRLLAENLAAPRMRAPVRLCAQVEVQVRDQLLPMFKRLATVWHWAAEHRTE